MQSNEHHIDQAFHERLKDLSVIPPAEAWSEIESRISSNPGAWIYKRIAASAAILIVAGTALWFLNHPLQDELVTGATDLQDEAVNGENLVITYPENNETPVRLDDRTEMRNASTITDRSLAEVTTIAKSSKTGPLASLKTGVENPSRSGNPAVEKVQELDVSESILMAALHSRYSGTDILPESELDASLSMPAMNNSDKKYWGLNGSISPLYAFRHVKLSDAAANNEFFYQKEQPAYGFSGGVSAIIKRHNRLSFVTGIHFTRSGQSYNDIIFYQNIETGDILQTGILLDNVAYSIKSSVGQITSGNYPHYLADYVLPSGELNSGGLASQPEFADYQSFLVDLNQSFDFLEIPFLLRYKVLDKKVGINLVSGLGANFLIDNEVYLYHQGQKVTLGETTRLHTLNFTGSLGLGFEYNLNHNWSLNLEPTFRYFLNSINTSRTVKAHPYYFGIYSGVNLYF